jgi:hypothetical protein
MRKIFKFIITPDDLGMRGSSMEGIIKKMARSDDVEEEPLLDFAKAVKTLFENGDQKNGSSTFRVG